MPGPYDAARKATGIRAGTPRSGEALMALFEALMGAGGLSGLLPGPDTRASRAGELLGAALPLAGLRGATAAARQARAARGLPEVTAVAPRAAEQPALGAVQSVRYPKPTVVEDVPVAQARPSMGDVDSLMAELKLALSGVPSAPSAMDILKKYGLFPAAAMTGGAMANEQVR